MGDFDFLSGKWTIRHRRLDKCMVGCDQWTTFETDYEAWQLLAGLANADRVFGHFNNKPFEGASVRTYDPVLKEWTIYWMDIWNTDLRAQARGRFDDGVGTFYGKEVYQGTTYRMRFLWRDITPASACWEQAYQDPVSGAWETNWIMEFTKTGVRHVSTTAN